MEEYKDQLEQFENYQSQELGKVKHMLLLAESALQAERNKTNVTTQANDDKRHSPIENGSNSNEVLSDEVILRLQITNYDSCST